MMNRLHSVFHCILRKTKLYFEPIWYFLNPLKQNNISLLKNTALQLIVTHQLGGGTACYLSDFIEEKCHQNKPVLILSCIGFFLKLHYKSMQQEFTVFYFLSKPFEKIIPSLQIESIYFNHCYGLLPRFSKLIECLLKIKKDRLVPMQIAIHDFYFICPSYGLINHQKQFCGIPSQVSDCRTCIQKNSEIKNKNTEIVKWRSFWKHVLLHSDDIFCFSQSSKNWLIKAYPELSHNHRIHVKPHSLSYLRNISALPRQYEYLNIGILGEIKSLHKGMHIIEGMLKIVKKNQLNITFTLIGSSSRLKKSKHLHITGAYKREMLRDTLSQTDANVFFIPSICPETFSYTTHELIQLGLPVASFNLGAQAEAISSYSRGCVIPEISSEAALEHLIIFFNHLKLLDRPS